MAHINIGFFSKALGMEVTCDVILPQRIHPTDHDEPMPVLWLLHGMYGNHSDWGRRTAIERYVRPMGLCVVMPSAQNSNYVDMAHGSKYYTYVTEELPCVMRNYFNLSDRREDNFICGLSMGGAGAFICGMSRPEQYGVIGCISAGAVNQPALTSQFTELTLGKAEWRGTYKDPLSQAEKILKDGLPCPRVYHCCGQDDYLLKSAHETRDYLANLPGNPFDYQYEEDAGAHTWDYWDEHIQRFLEYLHLPDKTHLFYV